MPLREAYRAARIEFGGVEQVKEQVRDARTGARFDSLLQHVRFAFRTLRRSSGFTGTARAVPPRSLQAQAGPVPVIVNEVFARKFFPGEDPVGKHLGNAQQDEPSTGPEPGYLIVRISANAKYRNLRREIEPTLYLPLVGNSAHFDVRTASDPNPIVSLVRAVVSLSDSNLPIFDVRTQTKPIEQTLFQERLLTRLSSFFGLFILTLACVGLYGLRSYEVSRRTREFGIRRALGAQKRDRLRLVLRQGLLVVLESAVVGTCVAVGLTRYLASMLFGVCANDPVRIIAVTILPTLVALVACSIPARRATRVDPMGALRYE